MSHSIVHVEFHVKNSKKSMEWYAKVFGWKTEYYDDMKYAMFMAGDGRLNGGLADNTDMSGTIPYILTEDIPGMLDKVSVAGGKIVAPETPIPNVGAFGLFADPDGNTLAFFKGNGDSNDEKTSLPHPIVHFEVQSKDMKASAQWYEQLFGWETTSYEEMNYVMLDTGQEGVGGGINPADEAGPGAIVYIEAADKADLRDMLEKAKANGGSVLVEPFDTPGVATFAFVADPDGNKIGLMKPDSASG